MKKILIFLFIFFASSFFFLTLSKSNKVFAQSVSCTCAYDNQADQCIPSYGTITYDTCGPGWICQCGTPKNYREDCSGDYGCVGLADCDAGVCVTELPPTGSQCRAGETVSWKVNPNGCISPSYLSGKQRTRSGGRTQIVERECCTPHPEPSPEPTRVPPSQPIPVYDPGCTSGTSYYNFKGVKTALGCLPTDPQYFINLATPWAVGIGAGIAFLLGVFGAMMIVLSAGNPEKMQAGKEMITSAIGGIILIVFSVFILRVIGVDVLKLFSK